jgi:WD40 repeat protein/tRNA A-37 threonylcarbamoyl transferase component Bud32
VSGPSDPREALAETVTSESVAPHQTPAPVVSPPDPLVGRRLGDFQIVGHLGEGGGGTVYLAQQLSLGRPAVIKLPLRRADSAPHVVQRFLREARLASRLDHPYAAHVYAFGSEPDGVKWIAMELVQGTPLDRLIAERGPLPLARFVPFFERLCEVVQSAHDQGIVHRDIKPQNVMVLTRAGRYLPKLLDLGIAKGLDETAPASADDDDAGAAAITKTHGMIGSPRYMAPEQWVDAGAVGPAADIYALGILAWELVSGQPPFQATTLRGLAQKHARDALPPLSTALPPRLHEALARATAKRPEDRPATALELAAAVAVACGAEAHAALPALDETLLEEVTLRAPRPIAETVGALATARNLHQALDGVDGAARALATWLAVLALASWSRTGRGRAPEDAAALLRRLRREALDAASWLALARALARPFAAEPARHPLPALAAWLGGDGAEQLARLLARRAEAHPDVDETRARQALLAGLTDLAAVLRQLAFLADWPLVVRRGDERELWMGTRRARRAPIAPRAALADGEVALVDADGAPLVRLTPLAQARAPMPGEALELFLLGGGGDAGARLVALPAGFEHADPEVWEWLRRELLGDDAPEGAAGVLAERAPYPGLAAYTADDAACFVGREHEVAVVVNRLRVQPIVAAVGRSGVGKSSFVQAGVLPALPGGWRWVALRPGAEPRRALATALPGGLEPPRAGKLVVFVDQFEELFTLCRDRQERERFVDELVAAATASHDAVRLVFTLRDDFLLAAEQVPALRDRLAHALVLLAPLGAAELERVLVEPARRVGYAFDDPRLPAEMVAQVADQPGALPLLSFAAARLWDERDRHFRQLRRAAYDAMGGVTGALVGQAEAMLAGMPAHEQHLVRVAFRRLVTSEGTRAVVAHADLAAALGGGDAAGRIIERLVASRLVVASEGAQGVEQIEIAHETLLGAWPRLVEWRRDDDEGRRLREQLGAAARQWHERGRPGGLLWRDEALAELRAWRQRFPDGLSALEEEFAAASVSAERRAVRRRRGLVGATMLALAALALVLYGANVRERRAGRRIEGLLVDSHLARARTALAAGQSWDALRSIIEARRRGASGPAIDLLQGLARQPAHAFRFRVTADDGRTQQVRYSPDGRRFASAGASGAVVWSAEDGRELFRLAGHQGVVYDVAWSHDGTRLATAGFDDHTVRVWDAATGRLLWTGAGDEDPARAVAWSRDDAMLCSTEQGGGVRLWDARAGTATILAELQSVAPMCAFGPGRVAVGTWTGEVVVFDPATGARVSLADQGGRLVPQLAFSARGDFFATVGDDRTVRVWDAQSGGERRRLEGAREGLVSLAIAPDGRWLAAGDRGGVVLIWDLESGRVLRTLAGHQGAVWSLATDAAGTRLASAGDDGTTRIWDVATGRAIVALPGHERTVFVTRFAPDGHHVLSAGWDGTVVASDVGDADLARRHEDGVGARFTDRSRAGPWILVTAGPGSVAWHLAEARAVRLPAADHGAIADDGALAATFDAERGVLALWRLPAVTPAPVPPPGTLGAVRAVAFARGRALVGDETGTVLLWDPATSKVVWRRSLGQAIDAIAVASDGTRAAVITADGAVRLVALAGGEDIDRAEGVPITYQHAFAVFSSDGRWLAAFGPGGRDLILVDTTRPGAHRRLRGHTMGLVAARFSADGGRLATTSQDGTVVIWDPATGTARSRPVTSSYLPDVVFVAGDSLLLGVDGSGALVFWSVESGQRLGRIPGATTGAALELVAPDTAAVVDQDGGLWHWSLPFDHAAPDEVAAELERAAPR